MQEKFQSLLKNQTWTLTTAPTHRKVFRGKWTFKLKRGAKGEVTRYENPLGGERIQTRRRL